jgi:beta-glucosidase
VIRRAAIAGTVLLTNRRLDDGAAVLPIGPTARIALIGPNSDRGEIQGGGSARVRPSKPVRPLAALRARGLDVRHHAGCSISKRLPPVRGRFEATYEAADGTTVVVPLERLSMIYVDPPAAGIPITEFGVTVRGTFVPDSSGEWVFGMSIVGSGVLSVNGETVVDLTIPQTGGGFFGMGSPEIRGTVELEAGTPAEIEFRYPVQHFGMLRGITIGAGPLHEPDGVSDAALIAADADVAVVVVGTTEEWETEGEDRTTMRLPGRQDELIRAVAAANPATVVVINAGSPVEMPWVDEVAAVLQVWFPGEEMGNALADVLLGVAEPGGRLPITIPVRLEDTPAYLSHPGQHGHAPYAEGLFIGYRWYDARHFAPRFPFGHGLGYTTWEMGPSTVAGSIDDGVTVTTSVTNTGSRAGSTVVQVYVEPPADGPRRPLRELRGFAKVSLEPGETIDAQVWLPERAFSTWHPVERRWWVPGGAYHLHVGESSRSLDVAGSVIAETP